MPPHLNRFPSGPTLPYHQQQFQAHGGPQQHASHQPLTGAPSYMNTGSQLGGFQVGNGSQMAGSTTLNTGGGFMDSASRMAFQAVGFQQQAGPGQAAYMDYSSPSSRMSTGKNKVRDVWAVNLDKEFGILRKLVDHFPIIALSIEFPGVIGRPMGNFRGKADYHYQCLRVNVDLLEVLQVGITLYNNEGEPCSRLSETPDLLRQILGDPTAQSVPSTWNFNFHFDIDEAMCNDDLIAHLKSSGVDVARLAADGIKPRDFASIVMMSGLVLDEAVTWVSFHGGYDFAFLVSALTDTEMPDVEQAYRDSQKLFFPHIYDVKYLIKHAAKDASNIDFFQKIDGRANTLESVAEALKMKKVSPSQIAGSNSLITGKLFFTLRDKSFNGIIPADYKNQIFGLGNPRHIFKAAPEAEDVSGASGRGGENTNGNNPSTPNNAPIGLASTPTPQNAMARAAPSLMTPGGGGGVFGNFTFAPGGQQ